MRLLYDIVFLVFGILYLPYLFVKGKMHSGFFQKFGILPEEIICCRRPVWIHGVSVGEAQLAVRLASKIKEKYNDVPVMVSTTTRTGNDMVRRISKGEVDGVFYYPFDLSIIVRRVVRLIDPCLYVMIETELWPNLLTELRSKNIPVALVNGRISENSFKNYRKIRSVMKRIFLSIDSFCMQSSRDAERIKSIGASSDKVSVTGNMKFDPAVVSSGSCRFTKEALGFGSGDMVLVAGSTHYPEEEFVMDAFRKLKVSYLGLRLVLAPRHIERTEALISDIAGSGVKYKKISDILSEKDKAPGADIVFVDTIGHLRDLYSVASVVFIGGSLIKKGGQNPIEAAVWGKPVVFGPYMSNFHEVANIFLEAGAAVCVKSREELTDELGRLLGDLSEREDMSLKALKVIEMNSGAMEKTVEEIGKYISD